MFCRYSLDAPVKEIESARISNSPVWNRSYKLDVTVNPNKSARIWFGGEGVGRRKKEKISYRYESESHVRSSGIPHISIGCGVFHRYNLDAHYSLSDGAPHYALQTSRIEKCLLQGIQT